VWGGWGVVIQDVGESQVKKKDSEGVELRKAKNE